jgi:hypothetical protein
MSGKLSISISALLVFSITYGCGPARHRTIEQQDTASAPLPTNTVGLDTLLPKETFEPGGLTTEDQFLIIESSKAVYIQSERIKVRLTIKEGIYSAGPCDRWFERETEVGWEKVGSAVIRTNALE